MQSIADHLEQEGKIENLTEEEKHAMLLLNKVTTMSAHVPESQASKIYVHNEIRSCFSEFRLPHIYFTFNLSAVHSPVFQLMFGDESIDLSECFPSLWPSSERAIRLAQDPVVAADFFDFAVTLLFEHLFGWDYKNKQSTERGGILGQLHAFYGTTELTERACFHSHFLLWMLGGMNPTDIHEKLKRDKDFENHLFDYFEDIIHHHLPDVEVIVDKSYEPRVECPPHLPKNCPDLDPEEHADWKRFMDSEIKILGEILQRHKCGKMCHKYGNIDQCQFQFLHDISLHHILTQTPTLLF